MKVLIILIAALTSKVFTQEPRRGNCDNTVDPCAAYIDLNDPDRSIDVQSANTGTHRQDFSLQTNWYRSVSTAGGDMPTFQVNPGSCNSYQPIHLTGQLPSESEGIVDVPGCLTVNDGSGGIVACHASYLIPVKSCCSFNVYCLFGGHTGRFCMGGIGTASIPCAEPTTIPTIETIPNHTTLLLTTSSSQHHTTVPVTTMDDIDRRTTPVIRDIPTTTPTIETIPDYTTLLLTTSSSPHHTTVPLTTMNDIDRPTTPVIRDIAPYFGPVAGGTQVTLSGPRLEMVEKVLMDPQCGTDCHNYSSIIYTGDMLQNRETTIHLTTYGINASSPQTDPLRYDVTVIDALNNTFNTGLFFEYRPNPVITNIMSRFTIVSGGIRVTVVGENLDSVAEPLFYIYEETRNISVNNDNDAYVTLSVQRYTTIVEEYNSTMMVCQTPRVEQNENLTQTFDNSSASARSRRNAEDFKIIFYYYIGLLFDGYNNYENYSETDPVVAQISVSSDPFFEAKTKDDTIPFDPNMDTYLTFQGEGLKNGPKLEDYIIDIGTGYCNVTDLLDNAVICRPPNREPKVNKTGDFAEGKPRVYVNCGNARFLIGFIDYAEEGEQLLIIIGGVCGAGVLFIIIIIVLCCVWRRIQQKQMTAQRPELVENDYALQPYGQS